jgi:dienelactone hydrolase
MSVYKYSDGKTEFEGYLALPQSPNEKRSCIMIAHAWDSPNAFFNNLADEMAKKGYVAFAIDVYGKGNRGKIDGDNSHLMDPLIKDRELLQTRLLLAFNEMRKHPSVMPDRIAILGYCFGGLCALDLARANPEGLRGAVSIHGPLFSPAPPASKIDSSVLVLHGWEDPVAKPPSVLSFAEEMTQAQADWQIHCYGHAQHAFTFVGANIPELGIKYDQKAHHRAEKARDDFFRAILL